MNKNSVKINVVEQITTYENIKFKEMIIECYELFAKNKSFTFYKDYNYIKIRGENVYDLLKNEVGVHCLIALPKIGNIKRQSSFCQVIVNGEESQEHIRTYCFHPYRQAIDHTTLKQTDNVHGVLYDGDIELLFGERKANGKIIKFDESPSIRLRETT